MNKPKMIARTRFLPCVLVLWLALVGCTPIRPGTGSSAGQAPAGAMTPGLAVVDSIQINQPATELAQVQVVVQGNLPDGCTELGTADVTRTGEQFAVTLPTSRPADAFCTQALVPYEETIPLDVTGLPAGEYVVNVNGVSETFALEEEELLPVMEARIPAIAESYNAVSPSATVADTVAPLEMPILVLHGRQDGWVSFRNAETIAAAAPETVTIIIYPNLGHALSPSRTPATDAFGVMADRPLEQVVDWIERSLE